MPRARKLPRATGYPQRTDLAHAQPIRVAPAARYGQRRADVAAQQAVPLPAAAPAPRVGPSPTQPRPATHAVPGGRGDFARPTEAPGVPWTSGLSTGPGPGPGILTSDVTSGDLIMDQMRGMQAAFPSDELAGLIDQMRFSGYT